MAGSLRAYEVNGLNSGIYWFWPLAEEAISQNDTCRTEYLKKTLCQHTIWFYSKWRWKCHFGFSAGEYSIGRGEATHFVIGRKIENSRPFAGCTDRRHYCAFTIFVRRDHFGTDKCSYASKQNANGEWRRKCVFVQNQNSNKYSNSGNASSCYTNNFAFIEFIKIYIRTSAFLCGWMLPRVLYLCCALILLLVFTRNKWDFSRLERRVLA